MNSTWITISGISFIFIMTTLGAATVYFFKKEISSKTNTFLLGLASGIMIAASIWSLLLPSIEASVNYGKLQWLPAAAGIIIGGFFLIFLDSIVKGSLMQETKNQIEYQKHFKLFLAVTLHNIPEGLAVGFAFGMAAALGKNDAFMNAFGLAFGIGIQNIPEGAAISLPFLRITGNKTKAFFYGTVSGAVEPIFALLGYFLAAFVAVLQPWLLAFAAGAMIFVVAEELIPDTKIAENPHLGAWGVLIGFMVMMILDVALS